MFKYELKPKSYLLVILSDCLFRRLELNWLIHKDTFVLHELKVLVAMDGQKL